MKRIITVFLIVMLLAGCAVKPKQIPQPVPEAAKPAVEQNTEADDPLPVVEEKESNLFDARKVKAGDMVAGLKVVKVEVNFYINKEADKIEN